MPTKITYSEADRDDVIRLLDHFGVRGVMVILSDVFKDYDESSRIHWKDRPSVAFRWKRLSRKFLQLADQLDDPFNE